MYIYVNSGIRISAICTQWYKDKCNMYLNNCKYVMFDISDIPESCEIKVSWFIFHLVLVLALLLGHVLKNHD